MTNLLDKSILELNHGLKAGQFSVVDIITEAYEQIEKVEPKLNSLITVIDKKEAIRQAKEKDKTLKDSTSPLHGLPYVLKDSYLTEGIKTTAASNILKDYIPPYSATIHKKLEAAGAILIGKANMDAWGHGATNENTDFEPVKNPYDLERVSGGSSGGSAVAVSARIAAFSIGEDTGGSIRNPASWNNITGLKVTYGRVSRYGCIAYASSFDTVGPMAKTAEDTAIVLQAIAGHDKSDATTSPEDPDDYTADINTLPKNLKLGIPKELFTSAIKPETRKLLDLALKDIESLGIKTVEVSMPSLEYALSVYYLIAPSETSSNLARYDSVRYGGSRKLFKDENMRRIMTGTYALSAGYYDAYYKKALKVRTMMIEDYQDAFKQADLLFMPVTTDVANKLGEAIADPLENMMIDLFTTSHNPVGVPSLAVPAGFTPDNLPIGFQLTGPKFSEALIFKLANAYQQSTKHHTKAPKIAK